MIGEDVVALWNKDARVYKVVSPKEAYEFAQNDPKVILLDVRTLEEYNELGHIANTILIPVQELESRLDELEKHKGKQIIAICRSGNRSGIAADLLTRHGFSAMNMAGGMIRWNEERLPVVRGTSQ